MEFRIKGIDATSGNTRRLVVIADNERAAIQFARENGIYAVCVVLVDSTPKDTFEGASRRAESGQVDVRGWICIFMGTAILLGPVLALMISVQFLWMSLIGFVGLLAATDWSGFAQDERAEREAEEERQKRIICPHCQERGHVRTETAKRKKGISGAKATGAIITGGLSILATGLSRKEDATKAHCSNCGATWYF